MAVVEQVKEFESLSELLEDLDKEGIQGKERVQIYNHFLMMKARNAGVPHAGSFELTPYCNFDCKMCYVHLNSEQVAASGHVLSTAEWIDIMHQAVAAGMMHAELTGGECLLHPGFKEIYQYLVSQGLRVTVLTNGELLSDDVVAFLRQYPPALIQVSIYGSDSQSYIQVTGRDAFADVIKGLHRLQKADLRFSLTITPSRYTQAHTEQLLELVRSFGVPYGVSAVTLPARQETGRDIDEFRVQEDSYLKIVRLEQQREQAAVPELSGAKRPYLYQLAGAKYSGLPCSSGNCAFHVNWKGELTPCIPYHSISKSILADGFQTAWKWVREQMMKYAPPMECKACELKQVCQSCPAEKTAGVFNGPVDQNVCKRWKILKDAGCLSSQNERNGV